jgi:hypothetical protein
VLGAVGYSIFREKKKVSSSIDKKASMAELKEKGGRGRETRGVETAQ